MGSSIARLREPALPLLPEPVRACVFTGPSLDHETARALLPEAEIRPPIRRGDLPRAMAEGYRLFGIIDGTYIVEPTLAAPEVRDAVAQGAILFGAASLGALRAVEFRIWGFQGIGVVYDWYLRGVTYRDDEVVAAMEPETFRALSEPLVNLRFACMRGLQAGVIGSALVERLLERYAAYHFAERRFSRLFAAMRVELAGDQLNQLGQLERFTAFVAEQGSALDIKRQDALRLIAVLRDGFVLTPRTAPGPS
ncbi:MAG TPA: TfuA-like protein [Polyangiales bacterium]|nr:TfuA-like protein [Polyangiales bacterium]